MRNATGTAGTAAIVHVLVTQLLAVLAHLRTEMVGATVTAIPGASTRRANGMVAIVVIFLKLVI
jgi:hypothetical protein